MQRFDTVQGDTGRILEATLTDEDGPVPLLGATVRWLMKPAPASGLISPLVNAAVVVVAPTAARGEQDCGVVQWHPLTGDIATAGSFIGQFRATWGDGGDKTFPSPEDGDEQFVEVRVGRSLLP